MSGTVMIMAGGTGGHVIPALAVAHGLQQQSRDVVWLGTHRGIEARLVPAANIEMEWVQIGGLRQAGWRKRLLAPLQMLHALWQSARAIQRRRPALVLGMGGFVSGPGGLAAWLLRRPLVIHEQNAVPGLTNKLLSHIASDVYEAFPGTFPPQVRARHIGNPVRTEIIELEAPEKRMAGRQGPIRILVFGGSQGALSLNQEVPRALGQVAASRRFDVRHQAGEKTLSLAREAYRKAGLEAQVEAYIEDMAAAYRWADLVICRSGALSVAEIAAAGLASILVPYPAAVDDHQTVNAGFLVDAGAACLLPEPMLRTDGLQSLLMELTDSRQTLLNMAVAARAQAKPHALAALVAACIAAGKWEGAS
jgi:UDP-N-acetylglucosamine--N-acetylmuramyl-(pentapeptide) pyrophosphoryl-undecaprenol N-acetylglucosamine transferase